LTRLRPKNWNEFQHYKRRSPPWVKLHKRLLDDFEFQSLPLASKALAPMLWLLASEDGEGWIDAEAERISFRLRMSKEELDQAIRPLLDAGFFEREDDSAAQALGLSDALPESESESEAKQLSDPPSPSASEDADLSDLHSSQRTYPEAFETFWRDYPTDALMSKKRAFAEWKKLSPPDREAARAAIAAFKDYCRKYPAYRPIHAERFLSQRRFEGFAAPPALSQAEIEANKDRADKLMRRGKYAVNYQ
jgi:hypothetical protein